MFLLQICELNHETTTLLSKSLGYCQAIYTEVNLQTFGMI